MSFNKKKISRSGLFKNSVLIYYLTKFVGWIYAAFLSGVFGMLLTSHDALVNGFSSSLIVRKIRSLADSKLIETAKNVKRHVARDYERSFFLNQVRGIAKRILTARVNTFGLFFFSYGFYLVLIQIIKKYAIMMETTVPHAIFIGGFCMVAGFFMLCSRKNVAKAIFDSQTMRTLFFDFLSLSILDVAEASQAESRRGFNIPFLFGMAFGLLSIFIDPLLIIRVILIFMLLSMVFSSPETGLILLALALPFAETMALAALLCLIFVSYALKWLCGRRVFRLGFVDFFALSFMVFVFFGGIFSIDSSSFKKMLLFICFMLGYFTVKNLLSSPKLVRNCLLALALSAAIVSIYGIYQNYFGTLSTIWQDTSVFAEIKGRVVSTFENPNVLGEYLILILPITIALMASEKTALGRFTLFVAATADCACLIFTWSRGAWLGFAVAMIVFLCVSSKYFLTAGLLSVPVIATFAVFKIDSSILRRITSFGDSSTSYRLGIWEGVIRMLDDIGLYGIGIGEGAFQKLYPVYALSGIETAPHSHNLYLQISVETGFFSLFVFLCFVFAFTQCSLSFCRNAMNRSNRLICLGIFCGVFAFLLQGLTDYVWYNYRIFLLFWLIAGLGMAHVTAAKNTDEEFIQFYH